MTSINLLNSVFLSMFFCTWATEFEVVILLKFLLFLASHVFSVVLWFKAFYKLNLNSFFVSGFSDGEEKNVCVSAGAHLYVGRIMAEILGEASVVVLWVCLWYIFVDSRKFGKVLHTSRLISLEKYFVGYRRNKARQWEKGSHNPNSW